MYDMNKMSRNRVKYVGHHNFIYFYRTPRKALYIIDILTGIGQQGWLGTCQEAV
jgi:hypothetical protein